MTKTILKQKNIGVKMSPFLHMRLKNEAKRQGKSITQFVNDLLDETLPDE